jgi:predicted nicotinamide N-methyase
VPEVRLHLASELTPIWQATESWLAERNVEPPFWAFAWPGGQALARYVLDNPERVAGRRVLDFAAGGGIAAIACKMAGAAAVEAAEIDDMAVAAIRLNAAINACAVGAVGDVVGAACRWDLILCGDVCYEAPRGRAVSTGWLREGNLGGLTGCAASLDETTALGVQDDGQDSQSDYPAIALELLLVSGPKSSVAPLRDSAFGRLP